MTPGTCGAIGERAQVILVWVKVPGRWECLSPTGTRSPRALDGSWRLDSRMLKNTLIGGVSKKL